MTRSARRTGQISARGGRTRCTVTSPAIPRVLNSGTTSVASGRISPTSRRTPENSIQLRYTSRDCPRGTSEGELLARPAAGTSDNHWRQETVPALPTPAGSAADRRHCRDNAFWRLSTIIVRSLFEANVSPRCMTEVFRFAIDIRGSGYCSRLRMYCILKRAGTRWPVI